MMKKILAAILLSSMVFSLCACGAGNGNTNNNQNSNNTQDSQTAGNSEADSESESEEGVVYTIKVVDESGNPVSGVMVQLCKDSCVPKVTNSDGLAEYPVDEVEDGYKASITKLPEGYVYEGEENVYYEEDATEVTLVVKAAQ